MTALIPQLTEAQIRKLVLTLLQAYHDKVITPEDFVRVLDFDICGEQGEDDG